MNNVFFVTGTDTEVGKTVASKAIMQAAAVKGFSVAGYKPVAAGSKETEEGWQNSDAIHLRQASNIELSYSEVNPCLLDTPASPHIAAATEGKTVDFEMLDKGLLALREKSEFTLVEGAGGWRVPVTMDNALSDWVIPHKLPVILVVGVKLGCLNHALLTAEAIRHDGLELVGWVANRVNPGTDHYAEIIETLEHKLGAPKLGEIPYMPGIKRRDLSGFIDLSCLGV
ncbi:dethiobiotin synthase [Parasalinivibrio latis]|uniref:dethiobiotin synthase n=1 Tax=Parasalinivibrio latis TaxID=2952610 RepID=UPI0030DE9948